MASPVVIASNWFEYTLYTLQGGVWTPFTPALPGGAQAAQAVWGTYDGAVWRHNGEGGTPALFWRLEGGSWVSYDEPYVAAGGGPTDYCQSADGVYVYAISEDLSHLKKFNGTSWDHISITGTVRSIWCDATGQHVYASPATSFAQSLVYSSDYGATWNSIYSQLGVTDWIGGVWGFGSGADHVVFVNSTLYGYTGGRLFRGKAGGPWTQVASHPTWRCSSWLWGKDEDNLLMIGSNASWNNVILKRVGSDLVQKHACTGAKTSHGYGRVIVGWEDEVVAVLQDWATGGLSYRSVDGGETWASIDMSMMSPSRIAGISLYGTYMPFATSPYLQNQDPAPDSTGNAADTSFYCEVVDDDNDLDPSTIKIYLNTTLVWSASLPVQPGFSGIQVSVTDGRGLTISPWDYYIPGAQTIRVTGSDLALNTFDESYTFYTVAPLVGDCGRMQWGSFQWGATQWGQVLDCSQFDVVVTPLEPIDLWRNKAFDFPIRFSENGDIEKTSIERSIKNNLLMCLMLRIGGIPLANHLGSMVPMLPFEPNDETTAALVAEEILRSVKIGEPRARVDSSIVTRIHENTIQAIVPYLIKSFSNWQTLELSLGSQELDK